MTPADHATRNVKRDAAILALNALDSPWEFAAALDSAAGIDPAARLDSAANQMLQDAADCDHHQQDATAGNPWRALAYAIRRSAVIQRFARDAR